MHSKISPFSGCHEERTREHAKRPSLLLCLKLQQAVLHGLAIKAIKMKANGKSRPAAGAGALPRPGSGSGKREQGGRHRKSARGAPHLGIIWGAACRLDGRDQRRCVGQSKPGQGGKAFHGRLLLLAAAHRHTLGGHAANLSMQVGACRVSEGGRAEIRSAAAAGESRQQTDGQQSDPGQ